MTSPTRSSQKWNIDKVRLEQNKKGKWRGNTVRRGPNKKWEGKIGKEISKFIFDHNLPTKSLENSNRKSWAQWVVLFLVVTTILKEVKAEKEEENAGEEKNRESALTKSTPRFHPVLLPSYLFTSIHGLSNAKLKEISQQHYPKYGVLYRKNVRRATKLIHHVRNSAFQKLDFPKGSSIEITSNEIRVLDSKSFNIEKDNERKKNVCLMTDLFVEKFAVLKADLHAALETFKSYQGPNFINKMHADCERIKVYLTGLLEVMLHASLTTTYKVGNSEMLSSVVCYNSLLSGNDIEWVVLSNSKRGDLQKHVVTLLGRDPRSDLSDPETWGPNCVLIDFSAYDKFITINQLLSDKVRYGLYFYKGWRWSSRLISSKLPGALDDERSKEYQQLSEYANRLKEEILGLVKGSKVSFLEELHAIRFNKSLEEAEELLGILKKVAPGKLNILEGTTIAITESGVQLVKPEEFDPREEKECEMKMNTIVALFQKNDEILSLKLLSEFKKYRVEKTSPLNPRIRSMRIYLLNLQRAFIQADLASHFGGGNAEAQAAVVIKESVKKGIPVAKILLRNKNEESSLQEHVFTVFGFDPNWVISDFKTWGRNCFIIDYWASNKIISINELLQDKERYPIYFYEDWEWKAEIYSTKLTDVLEDVHSAELSHLKIHIFNYETILQDLIQNLKVTKTLDKQPPALTKLEENRKIVKELLDVLKKEAPTSLQFPEGTTISAKHNKIDLKYPDLLNSEKEEERHNKKRAFASLFLHYFEGLKFTLTEDFDNFIGAVPIRNAEKGIRDKIFEDCESLKAHLADLQLVAIQASIAKHLRAGNAKEQASVVILEALKKGYDIERIILTNKKEEAILSHAFAVIGRDPKKKLIDFPNWGKNCFAIDLSMEDGFFKIDNQIKSKKQYSLYFYKEWEWETTLFSSKLPETLRGEYYYQYPQVKKYFAYGQKKLEEILKTNLVLNTASVLEKELLSFENGEQDSQMAMCTSKRNGVKTTGLNLENKNFINPEALLAKVKESAPDKFSFPEGAYILASETALKVMAPKTPNLEKNKEQEDRMLLMKILFQKNVEVLETALVSQFQKLLIIDPIYSHDQQKVNEINLDYNSMQTYLVNLQRVLIQSRLAKHFKGGDSEALTAVVIDEALQIRDQSFQLVNIERVMLSQKRAGLLQNLVFAVYGRLPESTLSDPTTWGKDCVIIDFWTYGKVITVEELIKNKELYGVYFYKGWHWESTLCTNRLSELLKGRRYYDEYDQIKRFFTFSQDKLYEMLANLEISV